MSEAAGRDVWGGEVPGVSVREVGEHVPDTYTPEQGATAWLEAVTSLGDAVEAARRLGVVAGPGARAQIERLDGGSVVTLVAALQDVRRELALVEAVLVREVGRDEATPKAGVLVDGRRYEVRKGANRKAWQHDEWKRDARQAVISEVGAEVLVVPDTGEQVNLADVVARVQEVHGSTAPRVSALRALGLDVGDYCETVPGTWGLSVTGDTPDA